MANGVGLRLQSLRGSRVRIPPPAPQNSSPYTPAALRPVVVSPNLALAWGLWVFAAFLAYLFLSGLAWGAGWGPTSRRQLEAAAGLLRLQEGDTVYDLGSGFGRAVIYFAKRRGATAVGVEIAPLRRLVTVWGARRQGVSARVTVLRGNLMDVDLRRASKVFLFLTPLLMRRVQDKVAREMATGTLVVSVEHRFPDWKPAATSENVHLYVVGAR
jgi:SAM-dependent methyltransferase